MAVFEVEKRGPITIFTLNRPDKYNALTPGMMAEMEEKLMLFMEDPEARVGIITGSGPKAFCAGADIIEMLPFTKETADKQWRVPKVTMRGLYVTKPLIAAVNGVAFGGGAELALSCDMRVASENAKFKFPEPSLGILPRLGGTQRLPRLVGYSKAMEIILCGETVTAEEALKIGMVNKVVPADQLMDACIEMAEAICKQAPLAVKAIKQAIAEGYNMEINDALELENRLGMPLYKTEDYEEGRNSFKEKRPANFQGK